MSDFFGIGAGVRGSAAVYFRAARQTGRTLSMIASLKDGDRIVFADHQEARRVERLAKQRGVTIKAIVSTPSERDATIYRHGSSQGRTIFDHGWLEQRYMDALADIEKGIDHLQTHLSGVGEAHLETQLKAKEMAKWMAYLPPEVRSVSGTNSATREPEAGGLK